MSLATFARRILGRNLPQLSSAGRAAPVTSTGASILDQYTTSAPSPQNTLDIFRGEWSSAFPEPFSTLQAGRIGLFCDNRVQWFAKTVGGVEDKAVLELGPLEGGHSYMLDRLGAARVVAIESNTRAFLKCLIVKELLGLERVHFLFGDFLEYLRTREDMFDLCIASGVLYHMQNPAELIALLSRCCKGHLCLWTHHYDATIISSSPRLASKFTQESSQDFNGFRHTLYRHEYQAALEWSGFCGGSAPTSNWMTREDIVRCLRHFGFEIVGVAFDQPDHVNGPALALVARRIAESHATAGAASAL